MTGLCLLVVGRCNLACGYCYQTLRAGPPRMPWRIARAALDLALRRGGPAVAVELSGGEPWLAPDLVRRIVAYLAARRCDAGGAAITLTTNGTLLGPADVEFLAANDVELALSCDGAREGQAARGAATFLAVDRLLSHLRRAQPEYLRTRVRAGMTLTGASIRHCADGVRYLLAKGVANIRIGQRLTFDPDWGPGSADELKRQLGEIAEVCAAHWERTGTIPVRFLAGAPGRARHAPGDGPACGAPLGRSVCVDTGGTVWGCPLFASSLQPLPPLAEEASRAVRFGAVGDAGLEARLTRRRRRTPRAFTHKPAKRSSHGRCRECDLLSECVVCPAAICLAGEHADPDVIPESACAFNRATLAARRRFTERTGGSPGRAWLGSVRQALGGLREALAAEGRSADQAAISSRRAAVP